ncbi:MAG: DUF2283 domain-containing protein [Planctomycetota bacterium]
MKVKYFTETDTLFIQLNDRETVESKELNENILLDIDRDGKVVSLTIEHAMAQSGKPEFSYETLKAGNVNWQSCWDK